MFNIIIGVDFSGAKLAGRNIWLAQLQLLRQKTSGASHCLVDLANLEKLCGTADREPALAHLVKRIAQSRQALWALDFPFGLPVELFGDGVSWVNQLDFVSRWDEDAYRLGVECVRRAKSLGGAMHIRRQTDTEAKTPFDCYHYRIIYQTFHGMRDVLGPLLKRSRTAVLPFHYRRLSKAERVLVEACPSSTLKRLALPHQNYKQAQGGPLTPKRLRTRRAILDGLTQYVEIGEASRRVIMRNGGGDALDAVIAAVGAAHAWDDADHRSIAHHSRYPREGRLYV
jgi:Protein of unknown function (DUF429)